MIKLLSTIIAALILIPLPLYAAEGDPVPLPTPSAVTGLIAINITQTDIDISWQENPPDEEVSSYNIYKDGVQLTSKSSTTYTASNLEPGTEYQFYITADNSSGEGPASDVLTVNTLSPLSPPTNLRATNIGSNSIDIAWDGAALSYEINTYDGVEHKMVGETTDTSYNITGLQPEAQYDIYIVSVYESGKSDASNVLSLTLGTIPVPASVEGIVGASFPYIKELVPFLIISFAIGGTFLILENLPTLFGRRRY